MPGGTWTNYVKAWTDFQEANTSYPLLNICYEDMKKVIKVSKYDEYWLIGFGFMPNHHIVGQEKASITPDFELSLPALS